MLDQPRRSWRTMLLAALICGMVVVVIAQRSGPVQPIVEAHESINPACGASDIYANSFVFSFAERDPAPSGCIEAFKAAAGDLGFSDTAVSAAVEVETNAVSRAGSIRLSSEAVSFETSDSSFEVVMVEIASCERRLVDVSPGFEVSQLKDRLWSSACDTDFYIDVSLPASETSD